MVVTRLRAPAPLLAALLVAMSVLPVAQFRAPSPGEALEPVGAAGQVVRLIQEAGAIVWTSPEVPIAWYRVQGWPSASGRDELGGAVMIGAVSSNEGTITFGEPPMLLDFYPER